MEMERERELRNCLTSLGFPYSSVGKESACGAGNLASISGSGRFPWRRKWQSTPIFLPGESHGQRSLVGYSPKSQKITEVTQQACVHVGGWKVKGHIQSESISVKALERQVTSVGSAA